MRPPPSVDLVVERQATPASMAESPRANSGFSEMASMPSPPQAPPLPEGLALTIPSMEGELAPTVEARRPSNYTIVDGNGMPLVIEGSTAAMSTLPSPESPGMISMVTDPAPYLSKPTAIVAANPLQATVNAVQSLDDAMATGNDAAVENPTDFLQKVPFSHIVEEQIKSLSQHEASSAVLQQLSAQARVKNEVHNQLTAIQRRATLPMRNVRERVQAQQPEQAKMNVNQELMLVASLSGGFRLQPRAKGNAQAPKSKLKFRYQEYRFPPDKKTKGPRKAKSKQKGASALNKRGSLKKAAPATRNYAQLIQQQEQWLQMQEYAKKQQQLPQPQASWGSKLNHHSPTSTPTWGITGHPEGDSQSHAPVASVVRPSPQLSASAQSGFPAMGSPVRQQSGHTSPLGQKLWAQQQQRRESNASPLAAAMFDTAMPTRSASFHNTDSLQRARDRARKTVSVANPFTVAASTSAATQPMRTSHSRSASWGGKQFNWPPQPAANFAHFGAAGHSASQLNLSSQASAGSTSSFTASADLNSDFAQSVHINGIPSDAAHASVQDNLAGSLPANHNPLGPFGNHNFDASQQNMGQNMGQNIGQNMGQHGSQHHMESSLSASITGISNVNTSHDPDSAFAPNSSSMETEIDFESLTMPLPSGTFDRVAAKIRVTVMLACLATELFPRLPYPVVHSYNEVRQALFFCV